MDGGARITPRLSPAQIRKRASQVDILLSEAHKDDLLGTPYNENALYGGAGTDRQPLYHLVVMTTGGGGLDVATAPDGQDLVYSFRPNPQEIDFTEPAAAEIQALQGGGRHVEHQGDAIGDLTIGGTTGVFLPDLPAPGSPFDQHRSRALFGSGVGELDAGIKSASGPGSDISPGLGRAWEFQENQDADFQAGANDEKLKTAGTSYRAPAYTTTGFDRIVELRAFFRLYLDLKKGKRTTPDITRPDECFLTWLNLKDGEWWIAEPIVLRVPRSRDFRIGYRYELELKILGRMDPANVPFSTSVETRLEGFDASAGGGAGLLERAQSWVAKANAALNELNKAIQKIQDVFNEISALGGSLANLVSTAFGVAQNAIGLIDDVSELAKDAMDLIGGIAQGSVALVTVPVRDWENLVAFADNFARSLELLGNQLPGASSGADAPAPFALGAGGDLEGAVRDIARTGKRAVNALRAEGSADSTDPLVAAQRRLDLARAVDPVLAAAPPARSVTQAIILQGETIRDVALRLLGDEARWKELVILNDLLPPYVTAQGGTGLLRGGDRILIPSSAAAPAASVAPRAGHGRRADLAERLYGTDLKLVDPTRAAGLAIAGPPTAGRGIAERIAQEIETVREVRGGDAVFDFALVRGVPNLVQALYIKASTQPGELRLHPSFGFALPVGTRLSRLTLFLARFQAYRTIAADDRIASLDDLSVRAEGDVLRMKVRATAVGTSAVVSARTPGF